METLVFVFGSVFAHPLPMPFVVLRVDGVGEIPYASLFWFPPKRCDCIKNIITKNLLVHCMPFHALVFWTFVKSLVQRCFIKLRHRWMCSHPDESKRTKCLNHRVTGADKHSFVVFVDISRKQRSSV
jgi:hypothetical protein